MSAHLRRWWSHRCDHCGYRLGYREARFSFGSRDGKVWHEPCLGYIQWRQTAAERLTVLGWAIDASGIEDHDLRVVAELRSTGTDERVANSNLCFRVLRSLRLTDGDPR